MSEYWKSTPKYWCKHCSIYVKDTPFERKQHETTGKHQGNLRRFLRGIQNDHERNERDKQKAKAEVERLKSIVGGSSNTGGAAAAASTSSALKSRQSAPTAADQKRQWAQLAEMGVQVPESYRAEVAMAGNWEVISRRMVDESPPASLSTGVRKRKHEEDEEEDDATQQTEDVTAGTQRKWGTTIRQYPGQKDLDVNLDELLSTSIKRPNQDDDVKVEHHHPETEDLPVATREVFEQTDSKQESDHPSTKSEIVETRAVAEKSTDPTRIKNEQSNEDHSNMLKDEQQELAAPIFKKRKARVQVNR